MKKDIWTYDEISSSHIRILRLVALIPFENKTLSYIGTKVLSVYYHIINTIYNTMFTGYGIRMIARKDLEIDYICEIVAVEGVCLRHLLLYLKRDELIRLVELCRELWSHLTTEESRTVRDFERKAHYFRTFLLMNLFFIYIVFTVTAQLVRVPSIIVNGTDQKNLAFRFYVDVHEEPMYTMVSILQGVVLNTLLLVVGGSETAGLYFTMMACGYLRSLQNRLLTLTDQCERAALDDDKIGQCDVNQLILENVVNCVRFHQKIMAFCEEVGRFTRGIFFIAVFTTVYNMSIVGVKLLENDEEKYKYSALLVFNLFQFFSCQWSPEYLLIESEAIGDAAYFASLEQADYQDKTSKILLLMMARAQRPIQLTAGGFINLSVETFGSMIKSAFSFFAVLRSFNS